VAQVSTSSWTDDIAQAMLELLTQLAREQTENFSPTGIYCFTHGDATSWYDFAITIFEEGKQFSLPVKGARFVPMTTAACPTSAKCSTFRCFLVRRYQQFWEVIPLLALRTRANA